MQNNHRGYSRRQVFGQLGLLSLGVAGCGDAMLDETVAEETAALSIGPFNGWQVIPGGGTFSSGPAVMNRGSNLDAFARGMDNAIYSNFWSNSTVGGIEHQAQLCGGLAHVLGVLGNEPIELNHEQGQAQLTGEDTQRHGLGCPGRPDEKQLAERREAVCTNPFAFALLDEHPFQPAFHDGAIAMSASRTFGYPAVSSPASSPRS